jgi:S1-C subfamily serine protease
MNLTFYRNLTLPLLAFVALLLCPSILTSASVPKWESAVVTLEVTRKQYEMQQPWAVRPRTVYKSGVIVSEREILTTAEEMNDLTQVRTQKGGRGKWFDAQLVWVDYHANLCLLTVEGAEFWQKTTRAELAVKSPETENMQLVRWKNGNLEKRKVDFNQYTVDDARLSFVPAVYMEFDCEMAALGMGEPAFADGKLAGLVCAAAENHARAIPASFIRRMLAAQKKGPWKGLGHFPFYWQPTENTATHQYLKLTGEPRGVAVIYVPEIPKLEENLMPHDIILQADGYDIDVQGHYRDPEFGQLILESLATRHKFAGDVIVFRIWRDGREQLVNFRLPKAEYSSKMLPDQAFDRAPEYLIAGGLVFQPLDKPFLKIWGNDWKRTAPFRLLYFDNEVPTVEKPSLVMLSSVLPDLYNLGYQEARALIVEKVNGRKVHSVADVQAALNKPRSGYHAIEFLHGDSLRRIVLDAASLPEATARVLDRYGIPKAASLAEQK